MIRTNDSSRQMLRAMLLCFAGIGSTLLGGCGNGVTAGPSGARIESMQGTVHGGQSPVQGATVKLYHTDPTATSYGAPAILIGSAVTDGSGSFKIADASYGGTGSSANGVNCPAGTQAYITAAGGYPPGQPAQTNGNLLMMAALGDCSTVNSNTNVLMNEVTTVAAAYALSGFMTTALDDFNNFYAANVGAPVTNSTAAGSVTPTSPAGLAHAFLNAAKLVNVAQGMPNTTVPVSTGGITAYGSVPYTEILTLADIMQPCINSTSGSNGSVISIPLTSGGSGYGASLTVVGGSGSGATGKAIINSSGLVTGLDLTAGGTGYSPTVTVTNALGTGAVLVPSLTNGVVSSVVIESGGTGYTPTVTIAPPPGSGTTATATTTLSNGVVAQFNITNPGSGYSSTNPPAVTVSSPITGVTATAHASVSSAGVVTGVNVTSGGSGYGSLTVSSPSSGTTATLNYLAQAGVIYNVSVNNAGNGYGPNVVIAGAGAGSGATGTANVSGGAVTSLTLTGNGSGYPVPTVTVAPPASGTLATATANLVGGSVSSISLVSGGSGYTTAPVVSISAPASGSTATATATIPTDSATANIAASSACSQLFALTPSLAGNYANNSLQAFINLARNPYPGFFAFSSSTGLLTLVPTTAAFQPTLASTPNDWSLSIVYGTSATAATTGTALPVPFWLTLDANDTAYLSTNFATTLTQPVLYGIGSYGVSVPAFGPALNSAAGRGIGADALGNIWYTNNTSTAATSYLYKFSASAGGTPTAYSTLNYPFALVVDASNNVWVGHDIAGQPNFDQFAYTPGNGGAAGTWAQNYTATLPGGPNGLGVDANQNIWAASALTSGANGVSTNATVFANSGTLAAPAYNPSGTTLTPVTAIFAGGAKAPYGMTFDASGNAWYDINGLSSSATAGIEEVAPNSTTALTSITPGSFVTGLASGPNGLALNTVSSNLPAMDGAGTMFIPDSSSSSGGVRLYSTVTSNSLSPFNGIKSCLLPTSSSTACGTTSAAAVNSPHQVAVDSTGSVWATDNSGGVTQILGIAAPSYPLLSIGKPGLSPGLTSVSPLP